MLDPDRLISDLGGQKGAGIRLLIERGRPFQFETDLPRGCYTSTYYIAFRSFLEPEPSNQPSRFPAMTRSFFAPTTMTRLLEFGLVFYIVVYA